MELHNELRIKGKFCFEMGVTMLFTVPYEALPSLYTIQNTHVYSMHDHLPRYVLYDNILWRNM